MPLPDDVERELHGVVYGTLAATLATLGVVLYLTARRNDFSGCRASLRATLKPWGSVKACDLKSRYLCVYLLAMFADWLQGPYVYALYQAYGYTKADNGLLFIFGFGGSLVLGTLIAGYADRYGRKRFCLLYCVVYTVACVLKHVNDFRVLAFARVLAGIATSLLMSVFESWVVCEASAGRDTAGTLGDILSSAIFGNALTAIVAGFAAQWATELSGEFRLAVTPGDIAGVLSSLESRGHISAHDRHVYVGHFLCPFDLAAVVLILCAVCICFFWRENYGSGSVGEEPDAKSPGHALDMSGAEPKKRGDSGSGASVFSDLSTAIATLRSSPRTLQVGLVSGCYEAAMYIFVFLWTPALLELLNSTEHEDEHIPYGLIFALLMLGCALGSAIFAMLRDGSVRHRLSSLARLVFGGSAGAAAATVFALHLGEGSRIFRLVLLLLGFTLFEMFLGLYFPTIGLLKSRAVPERSRAMIYNLFRVPLNLIVAIALCSDLPTIFGFGGIMVLCILCLALAWRLDDGEGEASARDLRMEEEEQGVQMTLADDLSSPASNGDSPTIFGRALRSPSNSRPSRLGLDAESDPDLA